VVGYLRRKVEAVRQHLTEHAKDASPSSPAAVEAQFTQSQFAEEPLAPLKPGAIPQFGSAASAVPVTGNAAAKAAKPAGDDHLVSAIAWVGEYLPAALQRVVCDTFAVSEESVTSLRGKPKKAPLAPPPSATAAWKQELAAELAAEQEVEAAARRLEKSEAPAAKKPKVHPSTPLQSPPDLRLSCSVPIERGSNPFSRPMGGLGD
jgi:hypothetical protein